MQTARAPKELLSNTDGVPTLPAFDRAALSLLLELLTSINHDRKRGY